MMRAAATSLLRRATLVLGLALCLLLLAVWWVRTPEQSLASRGSHAADSPQVAADEAVPVATREPSTNVAAVPRETVAARSDVGSPQGFELHGTLWVYGPDGHDDTTPDGSFDVITADGKARAIVVHGEWSVHLAARVSTMTVAGVMVGGRTAIMVQPNLSVPPSGWVDVRARLATPVVVHVVDAVTNAELRDVVLSERDPDGDLTSIADSLVLARGDSPLTLDPRASSQFGGGLTLQVVAHAPGYVAHAIPVDCAHGGNHTMALERGTVLEVMIAGADAHGDRTVKVVVREWEEITEESYTKAMAQLLELMRDSNQPAESRPSLEDLERDFQAKKDRFLGRAVREVPASLRDVTVIEGLVPATYLVTAEIDTDGPPVVLARERVALLGGQRSAVTLVLAAPMPQVRGAPLSGTLFVPNGWHAESVSLSVRLAERAGVTSPADGRSTVQPTPIAGMPGLYSWDVGLVTPGKHEMNLRLDSDLFRIEIDVGNEGRRGLALRLPLPAHVTLSVIDEQSGAAIDVNDISWNWSGPDGLHGRGHSWGRGEKLLAPVGSVTLQVLAFLYHSISTTQSLVPGENQVVVRAKRACGVRIVFSNGAHEIECPPGIGGAIHLESVDDSNASMFASQTDGQQLVLTVPRPGRYRLTIADTLGYRPVPSVELTLREGELLKHEVVLQRE